MALSWCSTYMRGGMEKGREKALLEIDVDTCMAHAQSMYYSLLAPQQKPWEGRFRTQDGPK
jgi:hypothetical protein